MENILSPLLGGIIIAFATSLMLVFNGKISGISGIIGNSLTMFKEDNLWRYIFLLGLFCGGGIMLLLYPELFEYDFESSYMEIIIAGLLVGFGTQMGSGCTSGHGVCGLPRFSKRSLIATLTFMAAGILTVLIKGVA